MREKSSILGAVGLFVLALLILGGWYVRTNKINYRSGSTRLISPCLSNCLGFGGAVVVQEEEDSIPTPTPTLSFSQEIEEFGQEVFGNDWPLFRKIIWCESGFDPEAYYLGNTGLLQINQVHGIPVRWLENWKINLLVGKQLFDEGGLIPWREYSGHCWENEV